MARINPKLLAALQKKLKTGPRNIYHLIEQKTADTFLPRHLAAVALAGEHGVNISKYASPEDLAAIRGAGSSGGTKTNQTDSPVTVSLPPQKAVRANRKKKSGTSSASARRRGTSVFVVHGRNDALRQAVFRFLRAIGLQPIEWRKAISLAKKPSPYVGEILDAAFREAAAVVVLLTPDDEAKLKPELVKPHDPPFERHLTGQARPNVLFEAGMALGRNPDSTVLVQIGDIRPFSDIGGRHVVRLSNSVEARLEFITKLANAGCNVDASGTDWHAEGDFQMR